MNNKIMVWGIISGVVAFLFCFIGGVWILACVGFDTENDAVSTGIGIYFIGKAFFVGCMLIFTARHLCMISKK